ncbi:MAG: hypothetical protein O9288_17365 [Novosphingobium sp.]|jgi:hypothetical protein|uniref:hypothetical protein n=1 Tax=Novosphingobium sp. TaxID=1874826 RepID=UPI0022C05BAA|nr:hypothetical protein [Novosphingobium sp.]MCZ8036501.1 hypothetical protein [Novosphingobium sp.]
MLHFVKPLASSPAWRHALSAANELIPPPEGRLDNRIIVVRARELLAGLLLEEADTGRLRGLAAVLRLIDIERRRPRSILSLLRRSRVPEVVTIATACHSARGCWFGDPVPYLDLAVTEERAAGIRASWPN